MHVEGSDMTTIIVHKLTQVSISWSCHATWSLICDTFRSELVLRQIECPFDRDHKCASSSTPAFHFACPCEVCPYVHIPECRGSLNKCVDVSDYLFVFTATHAGVALIDGHAYCSEFMQ